MKLNINLVFVMAMALFMGCQSEPQTKDMIYFGEKIEEEGAESVDEVLAKLQTQDEVQTKMIGTVDGVCQAKGCWMNLASNTEDASFFVKFKDYGFFVPKDLSGSKVVIEGKAYKEITPVEELQHYAEDEGASEEEIAAITEPKEEYKFMASGVKIIK